MSLFQNQYFPISDPLHSPAGNDILGLCRNNDEARIRISSCVPSGWTKQDAEDEWDAISTGRSFWFAFGGMPHIRSATATWMGNVSGPTKLLYCCGARNGEWTVEGVDWNSGKNAFVYTLDKSHRFHPLGGPIIVAPNGAIDCGCTGGLGIVRVQPKTGRAKGKS